MHDDNLRRRLQKGETVIGTFVSIAEPAIIEAVGFAGYDFALIDMEHTAIDFGDLIHMLRAATAVGITPLVRVGAVEANPILRVLDSGAAGVVAAHVRSADEARCLVEACRYPPEGKRGVSGGSRAAAYGAHPFTQHAKTSNRQILTVALIEDVEGVEAIEDIVAVPGLDVIMPGPGDLSASLGVLGQPQHAKVQEALKRVQQAVQTQSLPLGFHIMDTAQMQLCRQLGATFIIYSQDSRILLQAYRNALADITR